MQTMMATKDSIQLHRIASKSGELLENPKALMSSQNLCHKPRPNTSHIVHEVFICHGCGEIQQVQALINRSVMSICMTPAL